MKRHTQSIVLLPSTTAAASSTGGELNIPAGFADVIFLLNVSAASGTTPTLDVKIQDVLVPAGTAAALAVPNGAKVYDDFAAFTQSTGTGNWVIRAATGGTAAANVLADGTLSAATVKAGPISSTWRVKYVIGGTNPSFTFSVTAIVKPRA